MSIYVLQTRRNKKTAQSESKDIFNWMESYGIKVFDYNNFFEENLDKTLIKKEDVLVVHIAVPDDTKYDDRFKMINAKKMYRSYDGYNTDGAPMRKIVGNLNRLEINNIAYCHTNKNIDKFIEKSELNAFYMPHCIDFSNKRTEFNKSFDVAISGHLSHEVYPVRTRIFNYFNKVQNKSLNVSFLPHPGYDLGSATHDIIGEKYIDFLSSSWLCATCRGGWRNGMTAKYIEIAKANSLPIADIPDQLDEKVKDLIIEVNDKMDNSQMIENILNQIQNKSALKERIREYQDLCEQIYDQKVVIPQFIENCMSLS